MHVQSRLYMYTDADTHVKTGKERFCTDSNRVAGMCASGACLPYRRQRLAAADDGKKSGWLPVCRMQTVCLLLQHLPVSFKRSLAAMQDHVALG